MVKAVFVDYTGTLVADMDQNTLEVAERCYKNSSIESVEAMTAYWWKLDCPDTVTVRSLEEIPDLLKTF